MMLAAKPCCTDNDCTVKKELADKSPLKEKECRDCSPFFTCGTCAGFVLSKPFTPNFKPFAQIAGKIYCAYQQPGIQQVASAIWQPPKLS
jgi:hypothetical protein